MDTTSLSTMKNSFSPLNPMKPKTRTRTNMVKGVSALRRSNSYESSQHHHHHHLGGRLVDESMIVLRKRIHEMKVVERNYEPPKDWMEWEKQIYAQYDQHICTLLGLLQTLLINTRPSFALSALALLTFSVPTSVILLALHLAQAAH